MFRMNFECFRLFEKILAISKIQKNSFETGKYCFLNLGNLEIHDF